MGQVFKHRIKDIESFVNKILPNLVVVDQKGDVEFINSVVKYIISTPSETSVY